MRHARRARAWDPDGYLPAEPPPPQQQQYQQQQAAQQAYLRQELEVQRAQTARLELLQAQVAECLSDAEAEQQLELDQDRARQGTRDEPPPPPFDAPSFSAVSLGGDSSSVEAWGAEQPRVWRRRSSEYSSLSTEPSGAAPEGRCLLSIVLHRFVIFIISHFQQLLHWHSKQSRAARRREVNTTARILRAPAPLYLLPTPVPDIN